MKISPVPNNNQIQSYKLGIKKPLQQMGGVSSRLDEVSISDEAKELSFKNTLEGLADDISVRSDNELSRIDRIKDQVRRGVYDVPSSEVAARILRGIEGN